MQQTLFLLSVVKLEHVTDLPACVEHRVRMYVLEELGNGAESDWLRGSGKDGFMMLLSMFVM
ncbi:kinesin family protein [Moniliophthora roreri]|nr:kinesin family protein [Moniliophthora roreri]